ncbi:unnamed protein product [Arabidopsis halleri]
MAGHAISYWEMMKIMKNARCPVEFKKDIAVHFQREEAHNWWDGVVRNTHMDHMISWEDFREEFNRKFFPQEAMDSLENDFEELRQDTKSVREYEQEFSRLSRFGVRGGGGEQSMIRRFMRGLRPDIQTQCVSREFYSMIDLVEKAARIESGLVLKAKNLKNIQAKTTKGVESQKRACDSRDEGPSQTCFPLCTTCGRKHGGFFGLIHASVTSVER